MSEPSLAAELARFLERFDCESAVVEGGQVEARPRQAVDERLARSELVSYLMVWDVLHPEAGATLSNEAKT